MGAGHRKSNGASWGRDRRRTGSNNNHDGDGHGEASYDLEGGGNGNAHDGDGRSSSLDEIAFALNADRGAPSKSKTKPSNKLNTYRSPNGGGGGANSGSGGPGISHGNSGSDGRNTGSGGSGSVGSRGSLGSRGSADDAVTPGTGSSARHRRSRETTNETARSTLSALGMGGASSGPSQSISGGASVNSLDSSDSRTLFQNVGMMAWKAQHHMGRFFFPTSAAVTRRKKYDRSDSLDDLLSEEGASGSGRRRGRDRDSRDLHQDNNDDHDVDYFGSIMGTTAVTAAGTRASSQRKLDAWGGSTFRLGFLFLVMTVALTMYRVAMNNGNGGAQGGRGFYKLGKYGRGGQEQDKGNGGQDEGGFARMMPRDGLRGGSGVEGAHKEGGDGDNDYERLSSAGGDHTDARDRTTTSSGGSGGGSLSNNRTPSMAEDGGRGISAATDTANLLARQRQTDSDAAAGIVLPPAFQVLADVSDLPLRKGSDIPFYWHVPRTGGGTMNDILGSCLRLTLAADAGGSEGHGQDETLNVLDFARQVSYVNVDTSSHQGIERAKKLNLAQSGLADVVISPLLHEAASLFTPTHKGRMFTVFRHPIERAVSLFYFIQDTQWKQPATRNEQFADMSIENFYRGGFAENNWMTRFLTNELTKGELTDADLRVAKEVLRRKCLVGLLEEKSETFERIEQYFGWSAKSSVEQECLEKKLQWAWPMKHRHATVEEGADTWYLISDQNVFDMQLYDYAKELFSQQKDLFNQ